MRAWRAASARRRHLPSVQDLRAFGAHLREPHRASAWRAAVDGAYVTRTLRVCGARPLLERPSPPNTLVDADCARAVSSAVDAGLALLPLAPTCLRRSITLLRELRRLGLHADLHIGVRSVADRIEAHAWVQIGDQVVNDDIAVTSTYRAFSGGPDDPILTRLR